MTDLTFDIDHLRTDAIALYHLCPREGRPDPAYVELTEHGVVTAYSCPAWDNSTPVRVYRGCDLRFHVPAEADCHELATFLSEGEGLALLERIHQGHWVDYNGAYEAGVLDQDARAAVAALESFLEQAPCLQIWDAADWVDNLGLEQAWPTDLSLGDAAASCRESPCFDGTITGDLEEALLNKAEYALERGSTMAKVWLDALVANGRITPEQASELPGGR